MTDEPQDRPKPAWRGPLLLLLKVALAVGGVFLVIRLVRRVDWGQVLDAVGRLHWWQLVIVLLVVLVRQTLNASPLAFLVPGLGMTRAVMNGLAGTLITTFTPPPSEIVLRLSMFKSWRIDASKGAAALALNTLLFYLTRFAVPVLGLAIALFLASGVEPIFWWTAAWSGALTLTLIGLLALISRGEQMAGKIGRTLGAVAHKVRKKIDPRDWELRLVTFQRDSTSDLLGRMLPGALGLLGFILVDGTIVVLCLRFLDVPASELPYLTVIAAFLCVYPLTFFPFAGIGVLDAALIALLDELGTFDQTELVAALVIWRAATLGFPLLPGMVALAWWRRSLRGLAGQLPPESAQSAGVDQSQV